MTFPRAHIYSEHLDVGWLTGERLSAQYLDIDDLLTIGADAGLRYGKTSVSSDSTDGIYFGREGTKFGFAASRTLSDGTRQSVKLSNTTGLELFNPTFKLSGTSLPVSVTRNTDLAKTALPTTAVSIEIEAVGGGAAGWTKNGVNSDVAGGAGGATVIKLYDGTTLKRTITAAGGLASGQSGSTGAASVYAPGGAPGAAGSAGSGGGAGAVSVTGGGDAQVPHTYYSRGGLAGSFASVDEIDISGYTSPFIEITIGDGGAPTSGVSPGGAGGAGRAIYRYKTTATLKADVVPLVPTARGTITKSGATVTFPALGAGLWVLSVPNGSTAWLNLGRINVGASSYIYVASQQAVTFMSSATPLQTVGVSGGTTTIDYLFYSMGSWGV